MSSISLTKPQIAAGLFGISVIGMSLYCYLRKESKECKKKIIEKKIRLSLSDSIACLSDSVKIYTKELDFPVSVRGGIYTRETTHSIIMGLFNLTYPKFVKIYEKYGEKRRENYKDIKQYAACFDEFTDALNEILEESVADLFEYKSIDKKRWTESLKVHDHLKEDKDITLFVSNIYDFMRRKYKTKIELAPHDIKSSLKGQIDFLNQFSQDEEALKEWLSSLTDPILLRILIKIRSLDYVKQEYAIEEEDYLAALESPEAYKDPEIQASKVKLEQALHQIDSERRRLTS